MAGIETSALVTDLYQLTMLQGYFAHGMHEPAVFELFVRKLPPTRNFLLAAGLEQAIEYLRAVRFSATELEALDATGLFGPEFLAWLARWRFTGDLDALPEGTPFFPGEPVLRVTAPLPEAQLVESRLINLVHLETMIASKAARCVLAAPGKTLVDFGMRRAHGAEAALLAARASYIAGFAGTSNVQATLRFGIRPFGTMAHSFVEANESESEAFERFAAAHRGSIVLLIDTYDTETGARRVVELAKRLRGRRIDGVRLDSGDLDGLSRRVRAIFDAAGLESVTVFASGSLDERRVRELVAAGAPIDGFGIGTSLDVSEDAPSLDFVYKLQEYAGVARRKRSSGKATRPGAKQIYRRYDADGQLAGDVLTTHDDRPSGEPLLVPVLRGGEPVAAAPSLAATRERARAELARLPDALRSLEPCAPYPVEISSALETLTRRVDERFR